MRLKFEFNYKRFRNFFRAFNSPDCHHNNWFYEADYCYREPHSHEHFIFHPTSMGIFPNYEVNTDRNLLITKHEDVLRFHYFTMKAYFIKYCKDPFLKAYYVNLQREQNDNYYGFMKFYYSKDEVSRRFGERLSREDDIPF